MSLMRHIPNLLTYLRLLLIPVFVLLLIDPSPGMVWAALVVFTIAALTDYFDGMVARRFQVVSDTGKLLDPLADKILVMAAFIMLVGLRADTDGNPWVPPWMVVMVLAREIWVTGLRGVAAARGTVVAAGGAGKWKTTFQMLSIAALLVHYKHELFGIVIDFKVIGVELLALSLIFSYWGAIDYTVQALSETAINDDQHPSPPRDG